MTDETLVRFIAVYRRDHGYPPSYREIAAALHCSMYRTVKRIDVLVARGVLTRGAKHERRTLGVA